MQTQLQSAWEHLVCIRACHNWVCTPATWGSFDIAGSDSGGLGGAWASACLQTHWAMPVPLVTASYVICWVESVRPLANNFWTAEHWITYKSFWAQALCHCLRGGPMELALHAGSSAAEVTMTCKSVLFMDLASAFHKCLAVVGDQ